MSAAGDHQLVVLVLGVGGNVSQGILKALRLASLRCRVLAACIEPLSAGLYQAERAYVSPHADSPRFLAWLVRVCEREGVDAVLSGAEPVLLQLARHADAIRERTGAVCVVSPPSTFEIGYDKLLTCRWLEQHNLPFPRYASAADRRALEALTARCGFPLIAKPRYGKGGEGILVIEDTDRLGLIAGHAELVVQELVGAESEEYTAGCFCDRGGDLRGTLVMRRTLSAGTTHRAEIGEFPAVREVANRIVRALHPLGPCNVQLRVGERGPIPFELNVRFSGTTPARARFGFNEVEAALRHLVLGESPTALPQVTDGVVLRYWNEMYVDPAAARHLREHGELDGPVGRLEAVEDWGVRE